MPPIIRVEHLSKRYRLGQTLGAGGYQRFSESLTHWAKSPLRWLRNGTRKTAHEKTPPQDFWALNDVSFEVQPGEVVGIIGRNGAGKSTLLKILSRITEPTSGRITLNGRVASLLEVGTGFHPELTGRENIYLNGAILGMTKAEIKSKFDEIVAFAEVERFLDTPVKRYSSGMYVRLAFAVAAHLEPEILIVDEVLAVGDAQFQKKCLGKMQDVAKGGRTVLLVSHNLALVRSFAQTCLALESGKICDSGPTEQVIDRYESRTILVDSSVFVIPPSSHSREDQRVEITSIEWLSELPMRHGCGVKMALHYVSHTSADEVSFGIGFNSLSGPRLLTFDTDFPNATRFSIIPGEKGTVVFTCESLPLAPDVYEIAIGARSGDQLSLFYNGSVLQIEVAASTDTPTHIMIKGGGVRIPCVYERIIL
jgi:lipopolysaccharide transport system ATP-binding protein